LVTIGSYDLQAPTKQNCPDLRKVKVVPGREIRRAAKQQSEEENELQQKTKSAERSRIRWGRGDINRPDWGAREKKEGRCTACQNEEDVLERGNGKILAGGKNVDPIREKREAIREQVGGSPLAGTVKETNHTVQDQKRSISMEKMKEVTVRNPLSTRRTKNRDYTIHLQSRRRW